MDNHIFRSSLGGFHRQDVIDYIEKVQKEAAEKISALEAQVKSIQESESNTRGLLDQRDEENLALKQRLQELTEQYEQEKTSAGEQAAALEAARAEAAKLEAGSRSAMEENQKLRRQLEEMEEQAAASRRDKERVAQLELEARQRAAETVAGAERQAEELVAAAEKKAGETLASAQGQAGDALAQAGSQADGIVKDAEARAQAILADAAERSEARLADMEAKVSEAARQCNELVDSFQAIAAHVTGELRRMDVTATQLPISLDHLKGGMQALLEQARSR